MFSYPKNTANNHINQYLPIKPLTHLFKSVILVSNLEVRITPQISFFESDSF